MDCVMYGRLPLRNLRNKVFHVARPRSSTGCSNRLHHAAPVTIFCSKRRQDTRCGQPKTSYGADGESGQRRVLRQTRTEAARRSCQDIDHALHARHLPNGNIEAGVHIADVSNFVLPDTPVETKAASRETTVYLVDKRAGLPAIWELTPDADIMNVRFAKSDIASKAAFTYEEAQIRKDDPHLQDESTTGIPLLNSLAIKLRLQAL
ncbi:hypothetical protein AB1N83_008448 [Pleurotus pulmonarius]